jgi:hypothetical protein
MSVVITPSIFYEIYRYHPAALKKFMELMAGGRSARAAYEEMKTQLPALLQQSSIVDLFKKASERVPTRIAQEYCLIMHMIMKGVSLSSVDCPFFKEYHTAAGWSAPPSKYRIRYTYYVQTLQHTQHSIAS